MSDFKKLQAVNLLNLLSDDDLKEFATACEEASAREGEVVFHENDPGDLLYMVISGRVQISKSIAENQEEIVQVVFENDIFGEMTFIDGTTRSSSARALDDCAFYTIKKDAFDSLLKERPGMTLAIMEQMNKILTGRLRVTSEKVKEHILWNLEISGASALSMQHLISSNAMIELELANSTKLTGHILLVVSTDLGYQVTIKDQSGRLYVIPYSAINYIAVQEETFQKTIQE